jgi:hypothetical protein
MIHKTFPKHLLLAALALGFVAAAGAWQGPTQPAPQGNVPAPVNVGGLAQSKAGTLGVGGLGVFGRGFVSGASGFNLADSLTFGVDGKVGARAYCDINGQNCVATPGGAAGTTTATTTPASSCDPGYASVGSYCIQTTARPAKNFYAAGSACADSGAQLCSWSEWTTACAEGVLSDVVFTSAGKTEWIDAYASNWDWVGTARPSINKDCTYPGRQAPTASEAFRCCYPNAR